MCLIRRLTIFLSLLCVLRAAYGFEPHFIVREFAEVYSHRAINLVYQDRNCMIWLGTSEGLIQFTGTHFIPVPYPDSVEAESVTAIYQDRQGVLWAGTASGNIWKYEKYRPLRLWDVEEGLPKAPVVGFCEDNNAQLWIATYGEGLYVHAADRLYNINKEDGLLDNDIYDICLDGEGRIWAATDQGISICSFSGEKQIASLTKKDGLPDQIVRSLLSDASGNVWIGTYDGGIALYDIRKMSVARTASHAAIDHITQMVLFEGIELWIGTPGSGLWRYDLSSGKFGPVHHQQDLHDGEVTDLLTDVEGNLWVISNASVILTAFRPFETMDIPVGHVQAILAPTHEQIWVGSDEGLFYLTEGVDLEWNYERIPRAPFTSVASLDLDVFGNLWIGTLDAGLFVYDHRSGVFQNFDNYAVLLGNPIISFVIYGHEIWMATLGRGVLHARIAGDIMQGGRLELSSLKHDAGASHNFIFQAVSKGDGEVWLATDGAGLAYSEDNVILSVQRQAGRPGTIYSITEDADGNFWLVTPESGLVEYSQTAFSTLGIVDGLRTTAVSSVVASHGNELIVTHNKGIDLLIPDKRHFMYFDDEIGVKGARPVLNAVHRDHDRHAWIGFYNKIVRYTTLADTLSIHPRTWIAQVSVNQQPVDHYTDRVFPASQNFFAFEYVGLWYTSPHSVKYLYTLEGHDVNWKESSDPVAIYSNLKPGKYTFKVRASENRFFYDEPLAVYEFEIRPPFWLTPWFIALVVALVGGLLYAYMKSREARLKRIEQLNKEKVESQLRALKAQINPHFLFNSFNTLITIIDENTGNPDVPIEYVEKLADFYRSILQYREEEAISIPEEIQLVKNYYYLLQKRYGDNLKLDIQIDSMQGFLPPLVLQMLVENAVKHNVISKSMPLTIRIFADGKDILVVENNVQKKVSDVASTRFGLQSVFRRYQLISDQSVTVEEANGTFKVSLPIIQIES